MAIADNAQNYVVNDYIPETPYINIDVYNATSAVVESAASAYLDDAVIYADTYKAIIANKEYVSDRFMKDLCAEYAMMTDGGIDYDNNEITLHQKANEVYEYAISGVSLSYEGNITNVISKFNNFYTTYYQADDQSSSVLISAYESAIEYDTRAYTVSANINGGPYDGAIFYVDAPNAIGTSTTYTNYSLSGSSYSPAFTISHVDSIEEGDALANGAWIMQTAGESINVVASAFEVDINSANWIDGGGSEPESSTVSGSSTDSETEEQTEP